MDDYYYALEKPDSYGSYTGLKRQSKKSDKEIYDYLSRQDAYTMHKEVKRKFPRRKTFSKGIDDLWQIDLADLSSLASYNDNYRYLLTCIDVFSKFGRVEPLKSKNAAEVAEAFSRMVTARAPIYLQSDKGTEFLNATFRKLTEDRDIVHYTSENDDIKCAVVERWNRTLLGKLFKYMTHMNTHRYIDVLQDAVKSYNASFHRSIGMAPNEVSHENEDRVRSRLFPPKSKKKPRWKLEIGDVVRIAYTRGRIREKGYAKRWTEELFKVKQRFPTQPPTYGITDYVGEAIKGKFYAQELQKVADKGTFKIEKIIKTRRRGKKTEYFVKWVGYPEKFNSWVENVESIA